MSIPMSGATQSQGYPRTYYQYQIDTSQRTASSIHVRLYIWVRMAMWSSYFSFQIAHDCKVNGVYQFCQFKTGRHFWGHQWEGTWWGDDDFGWDEDAYDYSGDNWHGPWCVFDATVPMGVDDTTIEVIPCITRPPCTDDNPQEKSNWAGEPGYWRPFGSTEHVGPYAWDGDHEDLAFGNNRWLERLDIPYIGPYPRPDSPRWVTLNPPRIDVAYQDDTNIKGDWNDCQRAAGYHLYLSAYPKGVDGKGSSSTISIGNVGGSEVTFAPKRKFKTSEIFDGETIYLGVMSYDSAGITARQMTWGGPTTYFEIPSIAPDNAYVIGRKKDVNRILYRGEDAKLYYSGMKDGSYPIAKFSLVRLEDEKVVSWKPADASSTVEIGQKVVTLAIPSVPRPRQVKKFELRAYNTKGRPVYLSGTKSWFRFDVEYFGGVVYVYHENKWHEGIAYVYHDGKWRESDAVYVRTQEGWHTL